MSVLRIGNVVARPQGQQGVILDVRLAPTRPGLVAGAARSEVSIGNDDVDLVSWVVETRPPLGLVALLRADGVVTAANGNAWTFSRLAIEPSFDGFSFVADVPPYGVSSLVVPRFGWTYSQAERFCAVVEFWRQGVFDIGLIDLCERAALSGVEAASRLGDDGELPDAELQAIVTLAALLTESTA